MQQGRNASIKDAALRSRPATAHVARLDKNAAMEDVSMSALIPVAAVLVAKLVYLKRAAAAEIASTRILIRIIAAAAAELVN